MLNLVVNSPVGFKMFLHCRSQGSRRLSRGSVATRLLGFQFESRRWHGYQFLVIIVCCQVEVSATGRSLVQRTPTECGVSECICEALTVRRPWCTKGCGATGREEMHIIFKRISYLGSCETRSCDYT